MNWKSGGSETVKPGTAVMPWGDGGWALVVPAGSTATALSEAMATMPGNLAFSRSYGGDDDDLDIVLVYAPVDWEPSRRRVPGAFLRAMLEIDPAPVGETTTRRWMTDAECHAYDAGKADMVDALRRQVIGNLKIDRDGALPPSD